MRPTGRKERWEDKNLELVRFFFVEIGKMAKKV